MMKLISLIIVLTLSSWSNAQSHENSNRSNRLTFLGTPNAATKHTKFYWLSETMTTWREAWYSCIQEKNGILASIESPEEDEFIKDSLVLHSIDTAWTSGIYVGGWMWGASGNLIGGNYSNWGAGYPGETSNPAYVFASGLSVFE